MNMLIMKNISENDKVNSIETKIAFIGISPPFGIFIDANSR